MSALVYPDTLPDPEVAPVTADERRKFSPGLGPRESSLRQRDRQGMQSVTWMLTAAEAAIFQPWWETTLIFGAAWFKASWPSPRNAPVVRQFRSTPAWENLGSDMAGAAVWRVSAVVALRGAGEDPQG